MFTAAMARELQDKDWDNEIRELVIEANGDKSSYIPVYFDDASGIPMDDRIKEVVKELEKRGFKTTIIDADSTHFAEVHFSWGEEL